MVLWQKPLTIPSWSKFYHRSGLAPKKVYTDILKTRVHLKTYNVTLRVNSKQGTIFEGDNNAILKI